MPPFGLVITCDSPEHGPTPATITVPTQDPDLARVEARAQGWTVGGDADLCPDHNPFVRTDDNDLRGQPWRLMAPHRVRSLYPWARTPASTIDCHMGQYLVYANDGVGWGEYPTPQTLVVRVDAEPHRPVRAFLAFEVAHLVTVTVAKIAADEIVHDRALPVTLDEHRSLQRERAGSQPTAGPR